MSSYFSINNTSIVTPSGSVIGFLGITDPSGWVIADGKLRSNAGQYNTLLTLNIGTGSPGSSTTSTSYYPPNYLGSFLRGIGTNTSISSNYTGPTLNAYQLDQYKTHTHNVTDPGHGHGCSDPGHSHLMPHGNTNFAEGSGHTTTTDNNGDANNNYVNSSTTGITIKNAGTGISIDASGTGNETRPFNYGVNWIIKL